jgi:hypothetical protein
MDLYYQDFSFVPLFMQVGSSLGHHLESTVKALIGFLAHPFRKITSSRIRLELAFLLTRPELRINNFELWI